MTPRRQRLTTYMHGACQFEMGARKEAKFLLKGKKGGSTWRQARGWSEKLKSLANLSFSPPISNFSLRFTACSGPMWPGLFKKYAEVATI
jgi:hypothetical protein